MSDRWNSSNDGYLDHLARRGVQKGRSFLGTFFLIIFWLMAAGVAMRLLHLG